jgi:phenylalanine-4-hydroxylase
MVPALIDDIDFYTLLRNKRFPVTSFIRIFSDLDYIEEPDIFHEIFGHLPLLTWDKYGEFLQWFWKSILMIDTRLRKYLFRIFWFTVEFGLIRTSLGMRIYWAGILSSYGETPRSLDTTQVLHTRFDPLLCARTSYRYDIMQNNYFFIEDFEELFSLTHNTLEEIAIKALYLWDI